MLLKPSSRQAYPSLGGHSLHQPIHLLNITVPLQMPALRMQSSAQSPCLIEMLRNYKKPFNIKDVFTSHELATNAGIMLPIIFSLAAREKAALHARESLTNAEQLTKTIFFIFCGMRIYPHTELYEIALREGQISKLNSLLAPVFYNSKAISYNKIIKNRRKTC